MSSVFSGLVGAVRQRYTLSLRRVRRRAVKPVDGYHRWRAVPADSVPLSALFLVPGYATAPALMYVGLLMLITWRKSTLLILLMRWRGWLRGIHRADL